VNQKVRHISYDTEEGKAIGRTTLMWKRLFLKNGWQVSHARLPPVRYNKGGDEFQGRDIITLTRKGHNRLICENFIFSRFAMTPRAAAAKALLQVEQVLVEFRREAQLRHIREEAAEVMRQRAKEYKRLFSKPEPGTYRRIQAEPWEQGETVPLETAE